MMWRRWIAFVCLVVIPCWSVFATGSGDDICELFSGADGILSEEEFQLAVEYWQTQEVIPGTEDRRVSSEDLSHLLGFLATGETCGTPVVTIPDTTEVLGQTEIDAITVIVGEGESLTFNPVGVMADVDVGDVIAAPVTPKTPHGIFRRVVSKSLVRDGTVTVVTEPATLAEAIGTGDLVFSQGFTPQDLSAPLQLPDGITLDTRAGEFAFDFDAYEIGNIGVKVSGSFEFDPTVNLVVGIRNFSLIYAECSLDVDQRIELSVTCELTLWEDDEHIEIFEFDLGWFTIWVGFVPIPIHVTVPLVAGARGDITAGLSASVWEETNVRIGLAYDADATPQWSPIAEITFASGFDPLNPELGGTLTAYVGPHLEFLIAGLFGPYLSLHGFAQLDVDVLRDPLWILYGGAEAGGGFRFEFLGHEIADYPDPDILEYRIVLAQAGGRTGTLAGGVRDAVTDAPLEGVEVVVWTLLPPNIVTTGETDAAGSYSVTVEEGTYNVAFAKDGYLPAWYFGACVEEDETTHLGALLQVDVGHDGPGTVAGAIRHALTGQGVGGVRVDLRDGVNATDGPIDYTTTTQADGTYAIADVDAGSYTGTGSCEGYNDVVFTVVSVGNTITDNQDATITPILPEDEFRIILTWGDIPRDLDSHLTGPLEVGGRFHVAWYHRGSENGPERAELDRDDVTSYGPETTTIYEVRTGTYRYSVHDYTNRNSQSSTALGNSDALIQVYAGSELVAVFHVPAGEDGTLWTVFEIQDGSIVPINEMSYESSPGDVRSIEKEAQ